MVLDSSNSTESPILSEINNAPVNLPPIPIEIVSDEEMALIESAFAATRSSLSSTTQFKTRSIQSITLLSKRRLSGCTAAGTVGDIEDFKSTQKRSRVTESLLFRFRRKRGLFVTDITSTEWCEKQKEFFLLRGVPEANKAMKAGSARHAVLEEEVVKRVKLRIETSEDAWAVKFINFVVGINQLLFDGLTRELPLICFAEGVWMGGMIDEIRMPLTEYALNPTLVETKTRSLNALPSEPQRRNARLQLMCYKYLWDISVADKFPSRQFFDYFGLNPNYILSEDIRTTTANSGFPAETLDDLLRCYQNTCSTLAPARDQLLLRYEFQEDQSLIGEVEVAYDSSWVTGQIKNSLEFWRSEQEANYVPEEERWKCRYCKYASVCPVNTNIDSAQSCIQ